MSERIRRLMLPSRRWFDDTAPLFLRPRFTVYAGAEDLDAERRKLFCGMLPPAKLDTGFVCTCEVDGMVFQLALNGSKAIPMMVAAVEKRDLVQTTIAARVALGILVFEHRARSGEATAGAIVALVEFVLPYVLEHGAAKADSSVRAADVALDDVFGAARRMAMEG